RGVKCEKGWCGLGGCFWRFQGPCWRRKKRRATSWASLLRGKTGNPAVSKLVLRRLRHLLISVFDTEIDLLMEFAPTSCPMDIGQASCHTATRKTPSR